MSVRSVDEARLAVRAGVRVIDIKEPDRGPLGRADVEVWSAVREAVPRPTPVSVALGELAEWVDITEPLNWSGVSLRKIGLAGERIGWPDRWQTLRDRHPGPPWIITVYADWIAAQAPPPREILDIALTVPDCVGVLIDTWDKSKPSRIDETWFPIVARAKAAGRLVTLAGGLDTELIKKLAPLGADLFGLRSAVCVDGIRSQALDPIKLEEFVKLVEALRF